MSNNPTVYWQREVNKMCEHGYTSECYKCCKVKLDTQQARIDALEKALIKLRDCDWTITLPDRMDAVRDIARQALLEGE